MAAQPSPSDLPAYAPDEPRSEAARGAANDDDLQQRERGIAAAEAELTEQLGGLMHRGAATAKRFSVLQSFVDERVGSGCDDPSFIELVRRCHSTEPPAMAVERHWEASRLARAKAIAARRKNLVALNGAAQEFKASIDRLEEQLNTDEHAFAKMRFEEKKQKAVTGPRPATSAPPPAAAPQKSAPATGPAAPPVPRLQMARPATGGAERRIQPRAELEAVVGIHTENNFYTGFSSDISEGGLFISTVDTQPPGTVVKLAFTLPSGFRSEVEGTVRWVRDYNNDTPDLMPGMGVQFSGLNEAVAKEIQGFVDDRDPLFYDA